MYDHRSGSSSLQLRRQMLAREEQEKIKRKKDKEAKESASLGNLSISQPDDVSEQEADRIARKVMTNQNAEIPNNSINNNSTIQSKSDGELPSVTTDLQLKLNTSKGKGQSLDDATRNEMENKMETDFGDVKIHTGNIANEMNEHVNAKAFAYGQDIYFGNGNYNPNSSEGKELLAHELVHTRQQKDDVPRKIHRSALAEKKKGKKEVLLTAKMNYFGEGASQDFADKTTASIQQFWNDSKGTVTFKENNIDVEYNVVFKLVSKFYDPKKYSDEEMQKIAFSKSADASENFIRVVKKRVANDVSSMNKNQGYFIIEGADASEYAHEFGHSLGLSHPSTNAQVGDGRGYTGQFRTVNVIDDSTNITYPNARDYRGIDSIMIPDPNESKAPMLVNAAYRKDPNATITDDEKNPKLVHISSLAASLDPNKRTVGKSDIKAIGLAKLLENELTANVNNAAQEQIGWWGNYTPKANIPIIDQTTYYKTFLKTLGKTEAQVVQKHQVSTQPMFDPNSETKLLINPVTKLIMYEVTYIGKLERIDNSLDPKMKGAYLPDTIRHEYVTKEERTDKPGEYLINILGQHPKEEKDGVPIGKEWLAGFAQPYPIKK